MLSSGSQCGGTADSADGARGPAVSQSPGGDPVSRQAGCVSLYRSGHVLEQEVPHESSPQGSTRPSSTTEDEQSPAQPKRTMGRKKLLLSLYEREKLLDWEELAEGSGQTLQRQTQPECGAPPSTLQQVANAIRRSFSFSGSSTKPRPSSRSSFRLPFLFTRHTSPSRNPPELLPPTPPTSASAPLLSDLPQLQPDTDLQKLSRTSQDDLSMLSHRNLNYFSSLRVRRSGMKEAGTPDGHISEIVTSLRQKVSSQEQCESSSSSEEDESHIITMSEEGLTMKQKRRQERKAIQQARQEELRRLLRAQVIQRQLEEVEEKQRALEEQGVRLERILMGDTGTGPDGELLQTWYRLVHERNTLLKYESELMIFAQELELEDTQSHLQQSLRHRMTLNDSLQGPEEQAQEQQLFAEMMRVVEERDRLVVLLEEMRLSERPEDQEMSSMELTRSYLLHWS